MSTQTDTVQQVSPDELQAEARRLCLILACLRAEWDRTGPGPAFEWAFAHGYVHEADTPRGCRVDFASVEATAFYYVAVAAAALAGHATHPAEEVTS